MRSIQSFCRKIGSLRVGAIVFFVLIPALFGFAGNVLAAKASSKSNVSSTPQDINIAIVDPSGTPIREIKTQEELDEWAMEKECGERASPLMFVGIPKDKSAELESRLKQNAARRAAECMAEGYLARGKLDKAVEYYSRTIDLSGGALDSFVAHKALADIYQKQEKYPLALQQIDWLIVHSNEEEVKRLSAVKDGLIKKELPR
jgi:tetratricopeptide (TPR) repeat protein